MNLVDLLQAAQDHKTKIFEELDDLKADVQAIECALRELPVDPDFRFDVLMGTFVEGQLLFNNDRIYFHWTSEVDSNKLCLRPLVEYPIDIRLLCSKVLVEFFHAILKDLGVSL